MKYLIYMRNGIGDFMWVLPYAEAIRKADPDAYIVTFSGGAQKGVYDRALEMMKVQTAVNERVCYHVRRPLSIFKCIWKLGIKKFDYSFFIVDTHTRRKGLTPYLSVWAAKKSIGNLPGVPFTIFLERNSNILSRRHYYGEMLKAIGINPPKEGDPCIPREKLQPYLENKDLRCLKNGCYIGIAIGCLPAAYRKGFKYTFNDIKTWMPERWMELTERLLQKGYQVVLLGSNTDRGNLEKKGVEIPKGALDLIGRTSILEGMAVVSVCALMVSGDTGLMHVAYNVGTPTLALFGPTDPRRIFAYTPANQLIMVQEQCAPCWGTKKMMECKDNKCMKNITVQMVFEKIEEIMKGQR